MWGRHGEGARADQQQFHASSAERMSTKEEAKQFAVCGREGGLCVCEYKIVHKAPSRPQAAAVRGLRICFCTWNVSSLQQLLRCVLDRHSSARQSHGLAAVQMPKVDRSGSSVRASEWFQGMDSLHRRDPPVENPLPVDADGKPVILDARCGSRPRHRKDPQHDSTKPALT